MRPIRDCQRPASSVRGRAGSRRPRCLTEYGIPFDCFEKSDRVGGNWVFKNKNEMSSAYRSLHINTSRDKMAYSDFPLPREFPDYPHHAQIAAYFDAYVEHFGFREHIFFNSGVKRVGADDRRIVEDRARKRGAAALRRVDRGERPSLGSALAGARVPGHVRRQAIPLTPLYRSGASPSIARARTCLSSGSAIRRSISRANWGARAWRGTCSCRSGAAIGWCRNIRRAKCSTRMSSTRARIRRGCSAMLPGGLLLWLAEQRLGADRRAAGTVSDCPSPIIVCCRRIRRSARNSIFASARATLSRSPTFANCAASKSPSSTTASRHIDVIIWCTGYKISFPFFDEGFMAAPGNDIALWKRMIDPRFLNLFFVALVQPLCAMMPIAEEQSKLIAHYLTGHYALPPVEVMNAQRIEMHRARQVALCGQRAPHDPDQLRRIYIRSAGANWRRGESARRRRDLFCRSSRA